MQGRLGSGRPWRRLQPLAAALVLAVGGAGCRSAVPPPPRSPNVVLVVVDTLRADRLGAYGSRRGLTPFLDGLAERAWVFQRAYASAAWTKPSVASLLTSRFPSQHQVSSFEAVLGGGETTLPEVLQEAGWHTIGFSANSLLGEHFGYGQGYDVYRAYPTVRAKGPGYTQLPVRARSLTAAVRRALQTRTPNEELKPLFLYVQLMEPHSPYAPPSDLLRRRVRDDRPPDLRRINAWVRLGRPLAGDDLRMTEDVYDTMVAALDRELRAFFAMLGQAGVLDDAVVVVTADHGEELMDHGRIGHGQSLYDELVRVPLLVALPGRQRRVDVDHVVSLLDVAPTLLDLGRVPAPPAFEGRSLRPLLLEDASWRNGFQALARLRRWWAGGPGGAAYVDDDRTPPNPLQKHRDGVVVGNDKLLVDLDGQQDFYDLAGDPAERTCDRLPPSEREALDRALAAFRARARQRHGERRVGEIDERRREELRALGYAD